MLLTFSILKLMLLDRLDADLPQVSKMYPLSDDTLPLYRSTVVLGMTMTGDGADPLPHWATMQYTQTDSGLQRLGKA